MGKADKVLPLLYANTYQNIFLMSNLYHRQNLTLLA